MYSRGENRSFWKSEAFMHSANRYRLWVSLENRAVTAKEAFSVTDSAKHILSLMKEGQTPHYNF